MVASDRLDFTRRLDRAENLIALDADTRARLSEISDGEMFDVVFDCTGNIRAMEAGFDYLAHGGSYVLVSIVSERVSFRTPNSIAARPRCSAVAMPRSRTCRA